MPDRASPILLSVHDVMPSTLPRVSDLLDKLTQTGAGPADLLVVPGLDWRPDQIETLAGWHRAGHRLAGHGWCHRARHIRGWRHRLHSALISRDVAEHLALDRAGIADLIRRCHAGSATMTCRAPRSTCRRPGPWDGSPAQIWPPCPSTATRCCPA